MAAAHHRGEQEQEQDCGLRVLHLAGILSAERDEVLTIQAGGERAILAMILPLSLNDANRSSA